MTKSKVAKKFHLDPDGYLTTKPDRQLTTEEEATDAAEAAIGEALEEGGAIAEAIAASGGGMIVRVNYETGSTSGDDGSTTLNILSADKSYDDIKEAIDSGSPVVCLAQEQNTSSPYPHDYEVLQLIYCPSGQSPTDNPVFAFRQSACSVFVNPSRPQKTIVSSKALYINIGKQQSSGRLDQGMIEIDNGTSS